MKINLKDRKMEMKMSKNLYRNLRSWDRVWMKMRSVPGCRVVAMILAFS